MHRRALLAAGATGLAAALAGCAGDGADDEATTATETTTTAESTTTASTTEPTTTTVGSGGDETETTVVTVAPGGDFEFAPRTVTVDAGATVRWEWDGGGHNVRPAGQPADADWTGTAGDDGETYGSEHVYEHTFDVPGQYDYYCAPHRSIGMRGTVVVE
ncbi:plastocyanin/azurin family copper-binding protein [Halobacterium litoreum]|uniref:Plastocyanin/azurin family copper-binding protein n=1 Tax=Halobacterium litoreum TaxID=2039234 RepID=A0ABD5NE91_9EURY|nr:plastocyanin/azurin family copper-binding protein [Halobacterium litoreum]UHH13676.1 plastocyanin/azurin family copper-binding protein [Halobacterium litoreum]